MSLEDASVLAKLFSHLRNKEQIPSFMYAFQNLREERCQKNRTLDIGNVLFLMKPEGHGEDTAMRDAMMRRNHNEGRDASGKETFCFSAYHDLMSLLSTIKPDFAKPGCAWVKSTLPMNLT
jgi:hypothetical protein